jgi:hypothetical protein
MPWSSFENAMGNLMKNHSYGKDMDGWAKQFTNNYHMAILSGGDLISGIKVLKANTTGMENVLKGKLKSVQPSTTTTLLDVIGPAIIMYWTGATMQLFPPPKIPAPGALKNLVTNQGLVTNAGSWTPLTVKPNTDSNIFIKAFVSAAKLHLLTVSGQFIVTAIYPPNTPGPGVVPWTGYKV